MNEKPYEEWDEHDYEKWREENTPESIHAFGEILYSIQEQSTEGDIREGEEYSTTEYIYQMTYPDGESFETSVGVIHRPYEAAVPEVGSRIKIPGHEIVVTEAEVKIEHVDDGGGKRTVSWRNVVVKEQ